MSDVLNILVADDDPVVRHILGAILRGSSHTVDLAENGAGALQALKTDTPYDAIFLDMMLGDMTGAEVLKSIRDSGVTSKVIMLSAHQRDEAAKLNADLPPDYFLEKPFVASDVAEALMNIGF
ncbi:MAG: response regulator [Deltaproteobacteria bacterium]|nr:response regulator [Deltaproteobacteria bacterium]